MKQKNFEAIVADESVSAVAHLERDLFDTWYYMWIRGDRSDGAPNPVHPVEAWVERDCWVCDETGRAVERLDEWLAKRRRRKA